MAGMNYTHILRHKLLVHEQKDEYQHKHGSVFNHSTLGKFGF